MSAEEHAAARVRLAAAAAADAAARWSKVDPANIGRTWTAQVPGTLTVVSASQLAAAGSAEDYLDEFAEPSDVEVDPHAYAGVASDGGSLASLLYQPAITALMSIGSGASVERALAGGGATLDMLVRTQVADAGRAADQAALTARTEVTGYVRQIVGNTCARCTILAGRFYRWNAGFQRHPRCDCTHVPATRAQWREQGRFHDARDVYDRLSVAERQRAGWSLADQKAIDEGADLIHVTNMKGVTTAGSRRAAGKLTTDQIYKLAGNSRDEAIRLLRSNGYLRGAPVRVTPAAPAPVVTAKTRLQSQLNMSPSATRQLGGGDIADTSLLTFDDGTQAVEKVYGRRVPGSVAEIAHELDAEELGALVVEAVGIRAPAVARGADNRLLMEYLDGDVGAEIVGWGDDVPRSIGESDDGRLMGLADVLMGHSDRHVGNWIRRPDGHLAAIDHGAAFQYNDTIFPGMSSPFGRYLRGYDHMRIIISRTIDLHPDDVAAIRRRLTALRGEFAGRRRVTWYDAMMRLLGEVESGATGTRRRLT